MEDTLELTLKVTLDRHGLKRHLRREVDKDIAFFILGLVNAQLTSTFGEQNCTVGLITATGINPLFLQRMNSFARLHKRANEELNERGEVIVEDRDLLQVFESVYDVTVTPLGERWRITRNQRGDDEFEEEVLSAAAPLKN